MTIARKLWLGFGTLVLILLVASLIILLSERSIRNTLGEIVEVEEPTRAAAFEMEINTVEISQDVLDYIQTGDPSYREKFAADRDDFLRSKARHAELVDTPTGERHVDQLNSIYETYVAQGKNLMDSKDQQETLLAESARNFEEIDEFVDEAVEANQSEDEESAKLVALANIQYDVGVSNTSLIAYLRNPGADRSDLLENTSEIEEALERYRDLDLSPEEEARADELAQRLGATTTGVEDLLAATDVLRADQQRFLDLQTELDDVLDEDVQPWTDQQLVEAEEDANAAIDNVNSTIIALLLPGLLIGLIAAVLISRSILGSVGTLVSGARRIGRGEMDHRIEPYANDELGAVAVAFNGMLDRRDEANAALRESEGRFRSLSSAAFEGVVVTERGKVQDSNAVFATMFGYEESQVMGKSATDFVVPKSRELVRNNISAGVEEPFEVVGLRKDGSTFDVEVRGRHSSYQGRKVRVATLRDITERKGAETDLREAEARYRTVVEQIPAITYTQEMNHHLATTFVSPQVEAIIGYTQEEYTSSSTFWVEILHPEDRARVLAEDERTDETLEPFDVEYRMFAKDGSVVWIKDSAVIVQGEEGRGLFWQGFMFDITDRKRGEQELREAEVRYRTLVEQMPAITYTERVDEMSSTIYVSPQVKEMLGYSPEEWSADPELWTNTLHPDDREQVLAEHLRTNEMGHPFKMEYRQYARDGRVVWVRDEAALVWDDAGNPLFWQGVKLDITERKQAEEALQSSEARTRAIVETATDAIVTMTQDGLIRSFNPAAERIFGHASEEIIGQPLKTLMPERFRDPHEAGFRRYLDGGEARVVGKGPVQLAGLRKDGTEFPLELSLGEMREDDDVVVFTGIIRDVTERQRTEDEVREAESRFRQLFDRSVDALMVHDATGQMVDCNDEACRSLGYSREELLALNIRNLETTLITPERREEHAAASEPTLWQRAIASEPGEIAGIHIGEQRRKDGSTFPVEVRVGSVDYGEERMILASVRDTTERRLAQEALRHSEERYRLVALATNEAIWDSDILADRQTWNGAFEATFGYPRDLVTNESWWKERVHPDDRERVFTEVDAILANGENTWTQEYRFRRADGDYTTVVDRAMVVRDAENRPVRMIGSMMDVTERRRAEGRVRKSEAELRALFSAMDDIILVLDDEGRYIEIAPTNPSLLYRPSDELLGKTLHEVMPEDQAEGFLSYIQQALQTRESLDMEYNLNIDGEDVWFAGTVSALRENQVIFVARDITARKTAERDLRELNESLERRVAQRTAQLQEAVEEVRRSEERYGLVVAAANDGIYDWDMGTDVIYWNDRLYEIVGLIRDEFEVTLDSFFELVHPEDRQTMSNRLQKYLENGGQYYVEFRFLHADGEYRHCVTRGEARRDTEGRPLRLAGSVSDITERKRAEEALRQSEERYRSLFRDNPDSVYSLDLGGVFTTANPVSEEVTGYAVEELIGMRSIELMVPEDRELSSTHFRAARSGTPQSYEMAIRRKDGERVEIAMTQLPIVVEGEIVGVYGIAKDITARKRAEAEIRELNESLEERVTQRTEELQNTVAELETLGVELAEARDAAEAASTAKTNFLANMSHEIRTPMNGVIGMTELLLDTGLSEEQREYADTVRVSGENLLRVINDILDFSKIEAGAMRMESINFDLRTEVEEVVYLLAERAQARGLELFGFVEPGVQTALRGDPFRLRQILTNLIGNAIKFTIEGEVSVHASLREENEEAVTVLFEVRDTGIGLSRDQREGLFQSFSQADTSTTRRYGGTGLGLAICKQLSELMGGQIGVTSTPDEGSTFWFTARMKRQPKDDHVVISSRSDLRDLRVLIVDDNDTNRSILQKQTASWGMKPTLAASGQEALMLMGAGPYVDAQPYDIAIFDVQMPGMDGMQLASLVKDDPVLSATRIVVLTSMGQRGDGAKAAAIGISAYLTKPVRQSELFDCLATVMGDPDIPAAEETAETVARQAGQSHFPLITRYNLRGITGRDRLKLLVAEDNPVNQKLAVRMLEKLGYQVDIAENGREAVEALSHASYGAVLMDIQMPEMDGYEATVEIRRRERAARESSALDNAAIEGRASSADGRRTPVIAMTANAMQGDREKALNAGMDDYVTKPINAASLSALLDRWLSLENGPGTNEDAAEEPDEPEDESNGVSPLDPDILDGIRALDEDGDSSLLEELVGIFLNDAVSRIATLHKAFEDDDPETLERTAHALKGSSANMGARAMAELSGKLQDLGTSQDLSEAPSLVSDLEREWERVRPALENLKKN